jgi:pyridoxamine 5'-phosphate oxidase
MSVPLKIFKDWFAVARVHPQGTDPTAMTLATATTKAVPSARIVLLKAFDERGFVFYTHLTSRKSKELAANPYAALCFNWSWKGRQVRIEGKVAPVTAKEADSYFNSRPLISRLGAMASKQSQPLDSRATLMDKVEALSAKYSDEHPPMRPKTWSGWRLVPRVIEFWQEGEFRLHDREVYTKKAGKWVKQRLYP